MKLRYLLDTNFCIYLMKRASPTAAVRLAECCMRGRRAAGSFAVYRPIRRA